MTEPASQRAEESVIGALLRSEEVRTGIIGSGLDGSQLYYRPYRLVFEEVVQRYYADEPIDPLIVAEALGPRLAEQWDISEREAVDKVVALADQDPADALSAVEHAEIIKRHHGYRELRRIAGEMMNAAIEQQDTPAEIAGRVSTAAGNIITGGLSQRGLDTYTGLGQNWMRAARTDLAARAAGVELGAYFGIPAVDDFTKGLRPTELWVLGGDPGVGKSAIAWVCAHRFARRQMRRPPERRVGVLIFSLEMGKYQSSTRFAQIESGADGEMLRSVLYTEAQLMEIARKWAANRELPIVVNHAGYLRESELKALCAEGIRRHNTGLVIIDHFRFIKPDQRVENKTEADEQVIAFLKGLAKELNVAVVCVAHTTKGQDGRRPAIDDLRGSKMISAFADLVSFPYWPYEHASENARKIMAREEYELIWRKVRQGQPGTGELWMDMSTMTIR